ncbi:prepilin peptidase [Neptunicella sp. SCSIO 80796]|uniref:prepilin peptidase n=1 Tax=Neptunicella plasticusilytica TaxID=3117012 RepID=UPI003A4E42FE
MPAIFQLLADNSAFFLSMLFILGLLVGSFLNVVIHRLPIMLERGWQREFQQYFQSDEPQPAEETYNIITPRSRCPKCQSEITALQNIPVVSWLVLGGKCKQCKTPISPRYPIVELITGLVSVLVGWQFGFSSACTLALIFSWCMIALTAIDIDKMLLPDQICLPLLWLGLLTSINSVFVNSTDALIGAAVGYLSLWSLYWAFKLLTGKEGMGYGDFKLLAAIGAFVGWQQLPIVIVLSSFVGAVIGIVHLKMQGKDQSQPIPFGPYLAIAGWITLLYGDWIADQYWNWMLN